MTDIVLMANISTHGNNKTKAMTGSYHHLLLVLSVAAIMVMCMCLTPSLNIAQAQTANQSSSSSNALPSSSTTTTKQQGNVSNAALSNITGSIPLGPIISSAISSKVKTSLTDAVTIAQKAVGTNTSAT